MRLLVVFAHPVPESFGRALLERLLASLEAEGHEVRVADLYAEGFDPVLGAQERRDYHTPGVNELPIAAEVARLRWAQGLIFVYPTWWYSLPAMLKGWLDRVWVPFVTFDLPDGLRPIQGRMQNIRLLGGISTYGSPWWWTRFVIGDPGRRILLRGIRPLCHPACRTFWLGHYRMDSSTPDSRRRFLERVAMRAARL